MAVEIPVVVDIEKAFQDASKRLKTAMKPLEREIEGSVLNVKFRTTIPIEDLSKFGKEIKVVKKDTQEGTAVIERTFEQLWKNGKPKLEDLSAALASFKQQLNSKWNNGKSVTNQEAQDLQKAIILIEEYLSERNRAVRLTEMELNNVIRAARAQEERNFILSKEAKTLSEINARVSALRGNLNNIDPKSSAWGKTAREIAKATEALAKFEAKLAKVQTKPGSINRISAEMAELERRWAAMSKAQKFDKDGNMKASAQKLVEKYKQLSAEAEKYGKTLSQMTEKTVAAVNTQTAVLQKQSSVFTKLFATASAYVSVFTALRFVRSIRDVTAELEFQRVSLGRLLQDVAKGNYLFERIKEAAVESPFRIKDLITYTKQLAAYRIEQESLFDTTKRLADISAGLGVDMNRLILAYGQVRAAAVLRGQELRQFTEAGIPLVELLAEKFTDLRGELVTTGEVFKLISDRAVKFEYISEIFEDMTEKGGMFYKMQEEQAKTLKGRWEKLKDAYDIALQSVGDTASFQRMNDAVIASLRFLSDNLRIIVKTVDSAVISWAAYNAAILIAGKRTTLMATQEQRAAIATALRNRQVGSLTVRIMGQAAAEKSLNRATIQAIAGTNALTRALGRLKVAMITNPWLAAGAAVIGLVSLFTRFKDATDKSAESINNLNRAVDDMHSVNRSHERMERLIGQYEKLAKTTELNSAQTQTLERVTKKLADQYPNLRSELENNNMSLEKRLELVTKLNEEEAKRLQAEKDKKEATLKASESVLEDRRKALEAAKKEEEQATDNYNRLKEQLDSLEENKAQVAEQPLLMRVLFGNISVNDFKNVVGTAENAMTDAQTKVRELGTDVEDLEKGVKDLKRELYGAEIEGDDTVRSWKERLKELQFSANDVQIFTPEQLEGWHRLYDVSKDLEPEWKKLVADLAALNAGLDDARQRGGSYLEDWLKAIEDVTDKKDAFEAVQAAFGFSWGKKERTKSDTRLSDLKKDISEITNAYKKFIELRKYMSKESALNEMAVLFPQLKGWEPTLENTLERLRGFMKNYKGPKDKTFLEMQRAVDTEISNLKFDELKRKTDAEFKRVSDELKRSETARNFFENILGITGDRELAESMTISVYGDVGSEFAERIHKQLEEAFETFDTSDYNLWDQMRRAVENEDWDFILKNITKFGDKWQDELRKMNDDTKKHTSDLVKTFADAWSKIDDNKLKADIIRQMSAKKIQDLFDAASEMMNAPGVTSQDQDKIRQMLQKLIKMLKGQESLDLLKVSDEYIAFFSEINVLTTKQAAAVRTELRSAYLKAFNDGALSADELHRNLRAIDTQFKKLTEDTGIWGSYLTGGFEKANQKLQEYADNVAVLAEKMKSGKELSESEQVFATNMLRQFGSSSDQTKNINSYQQLIESFSSNGEGMQAAGNAFAQMGEGMSSMAADGPGAIAIIDAIFKGVNGTIVGIQEFIDELNRLRSEENKLGKGFRYASDWNKYITEGWEKVKSGDVIGATMNLASAVTSIINNIQEGKVEKFNDEIKAQSDILEDLEYSYGRVENAIRKAFGSDYVANYTKQIEILQAKQEAYLKQAEAERNKGKSADSDKIREYENNARAVADQIADMESQLSEFFSGTDLTSAAKDFATAWIDAYKEFGSTTDAMKEKFNDMVQEMIENSVAAQVMQNLLRPIFDEIDAMAREGGELSMDEVAQIAKMATDAIPGINDAMTTLMNTLAASGYNVRQNVGQFTGIARNIANASDESINGLAQGVKTQNWYLSYVPGIHANVAAILEILNGGAGAVGTQVPSTVVANNELMMSYLSNLEPIKTAVLQMKDELHSIISSKYAETNANVVAIRM